MLKWSPAIDHLIEDAAQGPDVTRTTNLHKESNAIHWYMYTSSNDGELLIP